MAGIITTSKNGGSNYGGILQNLPNFTLHIFQQPPYIIYLFWEKLWVGYNLIFSLNQPSWKGLFNIGEKYDGFNNGGIIQNPPNFPP